MRKRLQYTTDLLFLFYFRLCFVSSSLLCEICSRNYYIAKFAANLWTLKSNMNEINVSTTPTNEGKRDELKEAKKDENENESNMRLLIN